MKKLLIASIFTVLSLTGVEAHNKKKGEAKSPQHQFVHQLKKSEQYESKIGKALIKASKTKSKIEAAKYNQQAQKYLQKKHQAENRALKTAIKYNHKIDFQHLVDESSSSDWDNVLQWERSSDFE